MRLFGSRRPVTADTPLDGVQESRPRRVGEISRAEVQSSIDRALRILEARRIAGGYCEHELQVVLQVCPAGEHYAGWRKGRDRLLARSSKRWGTYSWPQRLNPRDVGIVLLPSSAEIRHATLRPMEEPMISDAPQITYSVVLTPGEDGIICAQIAQVPEAISQGHTLEEAKANVAEALELALQCRRDEGEALPAPANVTVAPVTVAAA